MFKLLKHDIRDSFLEVLVLSGAFILSSLLIVLGARADWGFLWGIGSFIYGLLFLAVGFAILRVIVKSFHSKLFTHVGYLTLTTPVSIDKILISKIIVSMLWNLTATLAIFASIFILLAGLGAGNEVFGDIFRFFLDYPGEAVQGALTMLTMSLATIVTLLFVLTLTNTGRMKKYKMLKAIFIFIVLMIILYIIVFTLNSILLGIALTVSPYSFPFYLFTTVVIVINLLWSVGFYFLSRLLIVYKLELE